MNDVLAYATLRSHGFKYDPEKSLLFFYLRIKGEKANNESLLEQRLIKFIEWCEKRYNIEYEELKIGLSKDDILVNKVHIKFMFSTR